MNLYKHFLLLFHISFLCSVVFVGNENVFKAWLWDAYWITEETLLFISAHNTVLCWNPFTNNQSVISSCIQQCILYLFPLIIKSHIHIFLFVTTGDV